MRWIGFYDIQSDIKSYNVCLSSEQRQCNVLPEMIVYRGAEVLLSNLSLHANTTYSARLEACNNVGLCTTVTSNDFRVDVTPPTVLQSTHMTT